MARGDLHFAKPADMGAVRQNAQALARYAALCQEAGIVPIVEPEVLMDGQPGDHSIDRCYDVTEWVLKTVFSELYDARVKLEGMILKPNMVIDGKNARKASVEKSRKRPYAASATRFRQQCPASPSFRAARPARKQPRICPR